MDDIYFSDRKNNHKNKINSKDRFSNEAAPSPSSRLRDENASDSDFVVHIPESEGPVFKNRTPKGRPVEKGEVPASSAAAPTSTPPLRKAERLPEHRYKTAHRERPHAETFRRRTRKGRFPPKRMVRPKKLRTAKERMSAAKRSAFQKEKFSASYSPFLFSSSADFLPMATPC